MRIREAGPMDTDAVWRVERAAFARDDEANLVAALLRDPTAQPSLSLLASVNDTAVGHALFTRVVLAGVSTRVPAAILAPLAVVPEWQRQGVGRSLIGHGATVLARAGVQLLFVLGDPGYYTRWGFVPAVPHGLDPPYPVTPEGAWMVRPLVPDVLDGVAGRVVCASTLSKPEYWHE